MKLKHVPVNRSDDQVVKASAPGAAYLGLIPSRVKPMTLSAAWRSGSERRFYDDHDRKVDGSPPNLVSLLRPWIRCFTMIISAW